MKKQLVFNSVLALAALALLLGLAGCEPYPAEPHSGAQVLPLTTVTGLPYPYPPPARPLLTPLPPEIEPTAPSETWPTLTPEPTLTLEPTRPSKVPAATATPVPFPTPAFLPTPAGEKPAGLQTIWYPYFPAPNSPPRLQSVLLDGKGQRYAQGERTIDFGTNPEFLGSDLVGLYLSPDQRLLAVDIGFGESIKSVIIDLATGSVRPILPEQSIMRFLTWNPDSQRMIVEPPTFPLEIWEVNTKLQKYQTVDFPKSDFGYSLIGAVAYSPDSKWLADAIVYPATVSQPSWEIEIGIRSDIQGPRTSLFRLPGGTMVADHGLCWSPDGSRLILAANVIEGNAQLWVIDVADGTSKLLTKLAEMQYNYPAAWSPDGQHIAVIKVESRDPNDDNIFFANVYLVDPETGKERQLTHFTERRISHLRWSLDGQKVAFTVSTKDYGEIWVTNLDGTLQYPVAGPTPPNAPFAWLSGR